jgi:hypothetical protein
VKFTLYSNGDLHETGSEPLRNEWSWQIEAENWDQAADIARNKFDELMLAVREVKRLFATAFPGLPDPTRRKDMEVLEWATYWTELRKCQHGR